MRKWRKITQKVPLVTGVSKKIMRMLLFYLLHFNWIFQERRSIEMVRGCLSPIVPKKNNDGWCGHRLQWVVFVVFLRWFNSCSSHRLELRLTRRPAGRWRELVWPSLGGWVLMVASERNKFSNRECCKLEAPPNPASQQLAEKGWNAARRLKK